MSAILDLVFGVSGLIARRLGERRHEWATFAVEAPNAAALDLRRVASELDAVVDAMKPRRRDRWRGRYLRARAEALREQAEDILRLARGEQCGANPLRRPWS